MQDEATRRQVGLRIREARKAARLTQEHLGKLVGVGQSVVADWERGVLSSWEERLDKLSEALNRPASYFATPSDNSGGVNTLAVRKIPVVGEVRGGDYRMAYEIPPDRRDSVEAAWTPRLAAHPHELLRALKVVGPSVNQKFPEGWHVIVVPANETDVRPGDFVVVFRHQGEARETTIKQLMFEDGRWVLRPRSSHPDHQEPIYLEEDGQDAAEIAYVVVGVSPDYERPPAPVTFPQRR